VQRAVYEVEAAVERKHWWFRGRRRILRQLLSTLPLPPKQDCRVLDVGCGTGANAVELRAIARRVYGVDAASLPLGLGQGNHDLRIRGDAQQLPFADASFDLVVALDVLEHLDDDDVAAQELARVLQARGALIVFVPAFMLLWGLQDEVSQHRRRYRRRQLQRLLQRAGFTIERSTYFNTLLFAPILAARLAMRQIKTPGLKSENQIGGPLSNHALAGIFALEAPIIRRMDLPLGVSLACIARKKV
jgi:ubiquinone/menaquinone biosynthesis C-methylase UbiE